MTRNGSAGAFLWRGRERCATTIWKAELNGRLNCPRYFAGLQALHADPDLLCGAAVGDAGSLQVWEPAMLGARRSKCPRSGVYVTNILTKLRFLAAD